MKQAVLDGREKLEADTEAERATMNNGASLWVVMITVTFVVLLSGPVHAIETIYLARVTNGQVSVVGSYADQLNCNLARDNWVREYPQGDFRCVTGSELQTLRNSNGQSSVGKPQPSPTPQPQPTVQRDPNCPFSDGGCTWFVWVVPNPGRTQLGEWPWRAAGPFMTSIDCFRTGERLVVDSLRSRGFALGGDFSVECRLEAK